MADKYLSIQFKSDSTLQDVIVVLNALGLTTNNEELIKKLRTREKIVLQEVYEKR